MQLNKCNSIIKSAMVLVFSFSLFVACSPKVGCPSAAEAQSGMVNRKGELSTKGGKSQLFSKKGGVSMKKAKKRRAKQRKKKYNNRKQ